MTGLIEVSARNSSTGSQSTDSDATIASQARSLASRIMNRLAQMRRITITVAVVIVLMIGVLIGVEVDPQGDAAAIPTPTTSATAAPSSSPSVSDVYQQALPSVVAVATDKGVIGTGVVANKDGDVLTAAHVIAGATTIKLTFSDGTATTATVKSTDPTTDIATLTPASLPEPLVLATIGGKAEIGGSVVAIGDPLGLTASVSTGIVSGLDRSATTADGKFSGLIQFDAAVNAGSSGGPLLDEKGNVIGIVVSIADPGNDDAFAGIGFAVPIGGALGGGDGNDPGTGEQGPQV